MDLFAKKIPDAEWLQELTPILETVAATCDLFERAGGAVGADLVSGWQTEAAALSRLKEYEFSVKTANKRYKGIGSPAGSGTQAQQAKRALDAFFSISGLAFQWGGYHYNDASGGAGDRARNETGLARKAALVRVENNGRKFAENALRAAAAGRAAIEAASGKTPDPEPPGLFMLFIEGADAKLTAEFRKVGKVPLSQVAMFGSWCYSRSAILGMIVSSSPSSVLKSLINPGANDRYWEMAKRELTSVERFEEEASSVGFLRLQTGYNELFGEHVAAAALGRARMKEMERLASTPVALSEAYRRWALDTAAGFGVGVLRPELVQGLLRREATPNVESWRRGHDAGLNIPAVPDVMTPQEQVDIVLDLCTPFFKQYYPGLSADFDEAVAASERKSV